MGNPYTLNNKTERLHLVSLANHLTNDELSHPLEAGWTVSGVLCHLAFWDQRALTLLLKWQQEGIGASPLDTDVVNEAMRLHCLAISPWAAVKLAMACAASIDQEIDSLDPAFLAEVEQRGTTVHLDRATHRRTHLGEIEKALSLG